MAKNPVQPQEPDEPSGVPEGPTPIPADLELQALEDRLATVPAALVPEVVTQEPPPPIGRSWAFDFSTGRFIPSASHGPLAIGGLDSLTQWVEKCLRTERGAAPVHPDGYGLERADEPVGQPLPGAGDLFARIKRALTYHPRIVDVTDYTDDFDPSDDVLDVTFTVVLDDDTQLQLTLAL